MTSAKSAEVAASIPGPTGSRSETGGSGSTWRVEYSVEAATTPEIVWGLWTDVGSWNAWSSSLHTSRLDGAFVAGGRGELHLKEGPTVGIELLVVEPTRGFTDETRLPRGRILTVHEVERQSSGVRITHGIAVEGPMAGRLGIQVAKDLLTSTQAFVELAEQQHRTQQRGACG